MKSTGIVRKLDCTGRISIPIELKRGLGIVPKDSIEIFIDKDTIVLRKYKDLCIFCNSDKGVKECKGKKICNRCLKELKKLNDSVCETNVKQI